MGIYNQFNYGNAVLYGGSLAKSAYIVDPFTATVLDYNNVYLSWTAPYFPANTVKDFRIVRNQFGYSETEEDGYILPVPSAIQGYYADSSNGASNVSIVSYDIGITSANIATLILPIGHGLTTGQTVIVTGVPSVASTTLPSVSINGTYTVTNYTATSVQFSFSGKGNITSQSVVTGTISAQNIIVPLVPGRYVYYTFWVMLSDFTWNVIGYTYALIPKEHNTVSPEVDPITKKNIVLQSAQNKLAELFPRVYTTSSQSYLDEIDTTSDLYQFIGGIAFTLDEILTYADLIAPSSDGTTTNPNFVNSQSYQLGFGTETDLGIQRQKRLIKEALRIYPVKGTLSSVSNYIGNLTNYYPLVIVSPNIMLSNQDSSFYKSVGNWIGSATAVVTADSTILGTVPNVSLEPYATDTSYVGKVVTTGTNQVINNGVDNVKLKGIPVTGGTTYAFSYYAYSPSATGTITPTVTFYDYTGASLATFTGTATATTSSWVKKIQTGLVAPGAAVTVSSYDVGITTASTATLVVPVGHGFVTGNKIIVSGAVAVASTTTSGVPSVSINGTYTVTATTSTTVQFAFAGYGNITSQTVTTVTASLPSAVYASLTLTFSASGTYYLDLMQFASTADSRYTTYYPARGIEVYLTPSKTNWLTNPSFETNTTSWTTAGSPTVTTPTSTLTSISAGTKMLQLVTGATVTTTSSPLLATSAATGALSGGQFVTFSVYAQVSTGTLTTMSLRLEATDTASSGGTVFNYVNLDGTTAAKSVASLTTTWTRFQVNLYIPSNYAQATTTVTAKLYGNSSSATILLDAAQLEPGYSATDYLDGSLITRGASWTGTANASTSILYRNKATRLSRLITTLPTQLPLNTPFMITTGTTTSKTLEFSGFSS